MTAPIGAQAKKAMRRLARATGRVCGSCDTASPSRCCSAAFCRIVETGIKALGFTPPVKPGMHDVPFLGPTGCVVPPELRPGCSGFSCPDRTSPALTGEHDRLLAIARKDPTMAILMRVTGEASAHVRDALIADLNREATGALARAQRDARRMDRAAHAIRFALEDGGDA